MHWLDVVKNRRTVAQMVDIWEAQGFRDSITQPQRLTEWFERYDAVMYWRGMVFVLMYGADPVLMHDVVPEPPKVIKR